MDAMPLSSKEKQEDYRARMRLLGLKEVRGVFLPPDKHAELKRIAKEMLEPRNEKPAQPRKGLGG